MEIDDWCLVGAGRNRLESGRSPRWEAHMMDEWMKGEPDHVLAFEEQVLAMAPVTWPALSRAVAELNGCVEG
jgi:hypothetical protein